MANFCPGIIFSIVWFLLVFFIGWPVASILSFVYIFLMPFAACIPPLEACLDQLLTVFKLPLTWAKKGVAMTPLSDCSIWFYRTHGGVNVKRLLFWLGFACLYFPYFDWNLDLMQIIWKFLDVFIYFLVLWTFYRVW